MSKKFISLLLVLCMVFSCGVTAFAEYDEDYTDEQSELEEWEASLEDYTTSDANAYTPSNAENLMATAEKDHAYDPNAEEEIDPAAEYVEGEVLFARSEGGISLFGADDLDWELADLGIYDVQEVYTAGDGEISLFGDAEETVWYKAKVDGDVLETVEALQDVRGIENAEPNYIFTTEAVGEPYAIECEQSWYLDCEPGDHRDEKGFHARRGWKHIWDKHKEEHGDDDENLPAPGEGTIVAVIDTGVDYTHQDLASSMWVNMAEFDGVSGVDDDGNGYIDDVYGIDATANPDYDGSIAGDPMDYNGHGTHVAGIIAMANNGVGGVGIAYGTKIMALKAGQATGTFSSADIAEAVEYAIAKGADVINMSFGGTGRSYLVEQALEKAFSTCVLVAAAGNEGLPTTDAPADFTKKADMYPAAYAFVLGVMASDEDGELASFSNWDYYNNVNAEYELTAPGTNIYSTLPGNRYAEWNGTSMAAPCVAAAAAVIRSSYQDKDEYNSRFIMGQLASATDTDVNYIDAIGVLHVYPKLDLYESLTKLPEPNLSVSEVFALDNVGNGAENDGDRIMDAGEVIDLGIAIRNQWGKTGEVTIKADAISGGGVANPYVEFITDEITLSSIGTFSDEDNGFIYDDGYLEAVSDPIQFKLADNTPNDSEICITLTVTTSNGWDDSDTTEYTIYPKPTFTFRVQKGQAVRGHITEDTVWDNDHYWIIENSVVIDEGVTLTVEPGTQIQFWSSDYEDAYGGKTMAYLNNNGTLNMIGTEDEPIECFPGADFEQYAVEILGQGQEYLSYCKIYNVRLGYAGIGSGGIIDSCEHCDFWQTASPFYIRYFDSGIVKSSDFYGSNAGFWVDTMKNTILHNFSGSISSYKQRSVDVYNARSIMFDNCSITNSISGNRYGQYEKTVFLGNSSPALDAGSSLHVAGNIPVEKPIFSDIFTYENAPSWYVIVEPYAYACERDMMKDIAAELGGTLLCFNDEIEEEEVLRQLWKHKCKEDLAGTVDGWYYIDYTFDVEEDAWLWADGNSYIPQLQDSRFADYEAFPFSFVYFQCASTFELSYRVLNSSSSAFDLGISYVLEIPTTYTADEISEVFNNFNYNNWKTENIAHSATNCAILNPILDTDPELWLQFVAPAYSTEYYSTLIGNYWGTENSRLINKMIQDDDDFTGMLLKIEEDPILTLDDDLSDIYPFVTEIWITEVGGHRAVDELAPGTTYEVHVTYNRDMDPEIQPTITYGGEAPFTDYVVHGDWEDDREWVGTTKISAVATGGTQIFRAKGGAAADDNWLVCGTDEYRFQFDIEAATVKSMVLNATGGIDQVELRWAQNDYDTLAGYNLYRSTSENGNYTKLNDSILSENTYVDTDVDAGVTYYYYFTVVDTDGNEITETQSNIASAAPLDNVKPVIVHTPVQTGKVGSDVSVSAKVTDNIEVDEVTLYYKTSGDAEFKSKTMTYSKTTEKWTATIPGKSVTSAGVQYYLEAVDTTGNKQWSASADVPYVIVTDSTPTLLIASPATINVASKPENITVYGTNLVEGMTVTVGTTKIENYTVNEDGTEITFATPDLPVGNYAIHVATAENSAILNNALTYRDVGSYVQINAASATSGEPLRLPLYVGMTGELTAFHGEIEIPYTNFSAATVELAEGVNATLSDSYNGEVLTISMASANNFNPGAQKPLAYLVLTPNTVATETAVQLTLTSGKLNGAETVTSPANTSVVIYPNFALTATVTYFTDGVAVPDVAITAAGVKATTGADGKASLTGITRADVTVLVSKDGYSDTVEAYDAVLVLQHSAKKLTTPLDASQLIAGDVDGNGDVDEVDASLILKKYAGLIDFFPAGSWKFEPSSRTVNLTSNVTDVTFTAIMVGDVDGSWASGE